MPRRSDCAICHFPTRSWQHDQRDEGDHRFKRAPFLPKRISYNAAVVALKQIPARRRGLKAICERSDWLFEFRDTLVALLLRAAKRRPGRGPILIPTTLRRRAKQIDAGRMASMLMRVRMERGSLAAAFARSAWFTVYRDTLIVLLTRAAG